MTTNLQTQRLTLRPLDSSDAERLLQIYQVEGILQYFPPMGPPTTDRIQRYITRQQEHWDRHGFGHWGITLNGENQIIGWAGLQFIQERDETEVGYLLDKAHWGKGFATEAALASIRFGFERHGLDHIIGLVHPENIASRHVIEKCGMTYVETIHIWDIDLMRHTLEKSKFTN